ncbi:MAG: nuclear transport factor 2 family protein [Sandaracinaceae bacterium]|nr:nuclear transport factor 2 family protein [Sandaracinaceae bacterium]
MDQAQSNIQVVESALAAIQSGDLDAALTRFEEDARWGAAQWLGHAGLHTGQAEIRRMLAAVRERFSGGYRFLGQTAYGTADHVFVETTRSGGDGPRAAGAEHVLMSFHVVMGRIREVHEHAYAIH